MRRNAALVVLLSIIIVALFIRAYGIDREDIWMDEATTAYYIHQPLLKLFDGVEKTPPLYHILQRYFSKAFGTGAIALRFLPMLFGTFTVYAIYLLGKEFGGMKIGIISAAVLALSPYHILLSQEARSYSLYILLSTVSMLFFIRSLRDSSYQTHYLISSLLLMYTHYFGLLVISCQALFIIIRKTETMRYLKGYLALAIAGIPLMFLMLKGLKDETGSFWLGKNSKWMIEYLPVEFAGGIILSTIIAVVIIYTAMQSARKGMLLYLWLLIPIIFPFLVSFLFPVFQIKYSAASIIPMIVLFSSGISRMRKGLALSIILAVAILSISQVIHNAETRDKEPWSEIQKLVLNRDPGAIIMDPGYHSTAYLYYDGRCFKEYRMHECAQAFNLFTIWKSTPLIFNLHDHEDFAYIISEQRSFKPEYEEFLKEHYFLAAEEEYIVNNGFDKISVLFFEHRK